MGRFDNSQWVGNIWEQRSERVWEMQNWSYQKAPPQVDRLQRVDYYVSPTEGINWGVDVKAPKRNGPEGCLLLEFRSVSGGKGWLYGAANYIMQWVSPDEYLVYRPSAIRKRFNGWWDNLEVERGDTSVTNQVDKFVGRSGKSRYGTTNQDVFMWVPYERVLGWSGGNLINVKTLKDRVDNKKAHHIM